MPARKDIKKILLIGSGPIVIVGLEFDYRNPAVKALARRVEVILVKPEFPPRS